MTPALTLAAWNQVAPLLLPLPLIVGVNLAEHGGRPRLRALNQVLLLAVPGFFAAVGLLDAVADPALRGNGLGLALTGAAGLAVLAPGAGRRLERLLPYDAGSQVHQLALVLTVCLVGSQVTTQLTSDVLASTAAGAALSRTDLVLQELPFLLAALLGTGLFTRRDPAALAARLGWARPAPWQVLFGLAAAGAFVAFGSGMDRLAQELTPDLARRVGAANGRVFGALGDPAGVITIALAAGICEEALFRGALQPRLGLLWPAVVFAAVHTQYGLSLDTAAVLVLAVGLGLVRRYANTTTSTICHVAYNAVVGFGLGPLGAGGAAAVEAGLLVLLALAWLRRGPRPVPDQAPGGCRTSEAGH